MKPTVDQIEMGARAVWGTAVERGRLIGRYDAGVVAQVALTPVLTDIEERIIRHCRTFHGGNGVCRHCRMPLAIVRGWVEPELLDDSLTRGEKS